MLILIIVIYVLKFSITYIQMENIFLVPLRNNLDLDHSMYKQPKIDNDYDVVFQVVYLI